MPQGKMKMKAKLPTGVKTKAIGKKRDAHFQKKNRPALPKKGNNQLREDITKSINEHIEDMAKEKATLDGKKFSVVNNDSPASSSKSKS